MHKKRVIGLLILICFMLVLVLIKPKIDRWASVQMGVPTLQP